jgi:alkanesulfonate monooxygenase SsuD/methylene tetrahydromethanopterin reductase-like flavin-dependent oxidoreductase (luciferase family)
LTIEVSTQFWPWYDVNKLVEYGSIALKNYPFSHIWMCDHFQYEETGTICAAMAMKLDTSVGPMVTFPWRNPLELAQRYSTISKLARPGRGAAIGLGGGGAAEVHVISEKRNPVSVIRESVQMLTGLLGGKTVDLSNLGAAGPKLCEVAGSFADGVIFAQLTVPAGSTAIEAGMLDELNQRLEDARSKSPNPNRPFKKIYNLHVSVSKDGYKAKQWAKRNASYGISGSYLRYPQVLERLGIDVKASARVAEAYQKGLGLEEAASRVTDDLLKKSGLVVAGTPEEVIEESVQLKRRLNNMGFDHFVFGVPIGPDVPEALDLLGREVIPAVVG